MSTYNEERYRGNLLKKDVIKKESWPFKPFSNVLFCPPSPGSILAKELTSYFLVQLLKRIETPGLLQAKHLTI